MNNDVQATLGTLDTACTAAPETIRYNGYARDILAELTRKGPVQAQAQDLADKAGLMV